MPVAVASSGDVVVEINGKPFTLRPTLDACRTISRLAGGLHAAIQRCNAMDFDTICEILKAGIGLNPNQAKLLEEEVYRNGTIYLMGPCITFIHIVARGGRPIPPTDETEDEQTGDSPLAGSA